MVRVVALIARVYTLFIARVDMTGAFPPTQETNGWKTFLVARNFWILHSKSRRRVRPRYGVFPLYLGRRKWYSNLYMPSLALVVDTWKGMCTLALRCKKYQILVIMFVWYRNFRKIFLMNSIAAESHYFGCLCALVLCFLQFAMKFDYHCNMTSNCLSQVDSYKHEKICYHFLP